MITIEQADTYLAYRPEWAEFNNLQKNNALQAAIKHIDQMTFTGIVRDPNQEHVFPRYGSYFDSQKGLEIEFGNDVPTRVLNAIAELALSIAKNPLLFDPEVEVDAIEISDAITISGIKNPSKLPAVVRELLKPLRVNGGANLWWRSN